MCSDMNYRIKMRRHWAYFVERVIIVLSILSFMTNGCFLFGNDSTADRFGYVSTMLLTAVAFMLVTASFIPHLNYLTLLDKYVYFVFVFILWIAILVGISGFWHDELDNEKTDHFLLIINLTIWTLVHIIFGIQSYRAYTLENKKIGMIKEEVDGQLTQRPYASLDGIDEINKTCQSVKHGNRTILLKCSHQMSRAQRKNSFLVDQ